MKDRTHDYYGVFYWLAGLAFVVPLVVAFQAFKEVRPTTKPTPHPDPSGVDHNLFDYLLRTYTAGGLIDYEGISRDYLFTTYLRQLSAADPRQLATDAENLALYCNAYNAFVIHGVIVHKIHRNERNVLTFRPSDIAQEISQLKEQISEEQKSATGNPSMLVEWAHEIEQLELKSGFFDLKEHILAGETMSLNHLEHTVIRPTFGDPRIHVALVCAAKSCPAIRPEAYQGSRLEQQLQDQARLFASNERYVRYDAAANELQLSPILSWYADDWQTAGGALEWLKTLVSSDALHERIEAAQSGQIPVVYNSYDWSLNSQAAGSTATATKPQFGSGSVPNE